MIPKITPSTDPGIATLIRKKETANENRSEIWMMILGQIDMMKRESAAMMKLHPPATSVAEEWWDTSNAKQ